ncbi:hypothetical protein BHM03_00062490 [Ensete ventricosum]|nr:hypothetical protein BHM03_00062490 [Ensete ventricosum]
MGSSPAGMTGCGQATGGGCPLQGCKGQPRGQGCCLQGRPLAGVAASKGSARTRRCLQPTRWRSKAVAPVVRAAAHADSVQRRHLRRAATTATTQMGARRG